MLYHILYSLHNTYSWLNIFRYQTFRAALAFFVAFCFVLIFQPIFIRKIKEWGLKGQPIRNDGPKSHGDKQGTPTMGGLVLVVAVLFSTLLFGDLTNSYVWLTIAVIVAYAALGFIDDWKKITQQTSKGLSGLQKIYWQCGAAALAALALLALGFSSDLTFPFYKEARLTLGIFFVPFVILVVVGASNAVNLTDGLDGLAIGPIMTVAATYALFAYVAGRADYATYLGVAYVKEVGEISIILSAILAAGLGFLWFNTFPAQVFMGDLGALSMGAVLGFSSVLVKHEILLIFAGGIFVIEALSVIVQVTSFKLTGKRVFKMAPVHHHFELVGWAEPKIIVRFWIISIVLAIMCLTSLKLR